MCHGSFSLFTLKKYGNWIHHLTCSYIFKLHNWACHIWPIPLGHCSLKKKTHQWHNTHKLLRKTWWKLSCWPKYLTCTKTRFDVTWWSTNCEHGFCVASGPLSETINILATSISFHIFPSPNHDMWHGRHLSSVARWGDRHCVQLKKILSSRGDTSVCQSNLRVVWSCFCYSHRNCLH